MATLNIGMKVNRAISGATTVSANAYAMVTYLASASDAGNYYTASPQGMVVTRHFGPGQSIPSSFTSSYYAMTYSTSDPALHSVTWNLQSGVELINTI